MWFIPESANNVSPSKQTVFRALQRAFRDELGVCVVNFAVVTEQEVVRIIDILFAHKELGLFVIDVKNYPISEVLEVDAVGHWRLAGWPTLASPIAEQVTLLANGFRNTLFLDETTPIYPLVALPNITKREWQQRDYPLQPSLIFHDELEQNTIRIKLHEISERRPVDDARWDWLLNRFAQVYPDAGIEYQEAYGGGGPTFSPPKVFISYRRSDAGMAAGRIADHFIQAFGPEQIFIDVNNIDLGANWKRTIEERLDESDVVLAVVGPNWLTTMDEIGRRKLDVEDDTVRWEIGSAFEKSIQVIPVFCEIDRPPSREALPAPLQPLVDYQGCFIDLRNFSLMIQRLIEGVKYIKYRRTPLET